MTDLKNARGFLVFATGEVDEIDQDGDIAGGWSAPDVYDDLVFAGFPLSRDDIAKTFDGIIDVSTDGQRVVVYASGEAYDMGEASEVFLDWYHRSAR